jgi:hypothetical protein
VQSSSTHLEKALQPPHLEDTLSNDNKQLEQTPPLNTAIGALGRIPVHALANNNVPLLIADLSHVIGQFADLGLEGILRHLRLGHVDDAVDVEGDLLGVGGPALVAEAVVVFAVGLGSEGVVLVGNGLLVVLAVAEGVLNLERAVSRKSIIIVSSMYPLFLNLKLTRTPPDPTRGREHPE